MFPVLLGKSFCYIVGRVLDSILSEDFFSIRIYVKLIQTKCHPYVIHYFDIQNYVILILFCSHFGDVTEPFGMISVCVAFDLTTLNKHYKYNSRYPCRIVRKHAVRTHAYTCGLKPAPNTDVCMHPNRGHHTRSRASKLLSLNMRRRQLRDVVKYAAYY